MSKPVESLLDPNLGHSKPLMAWSWSRDEFGRNKDLSHASFNDVGCVRGAHYQHYCVIHNSDEYISFGAVTFLENRQYNMILARNKIKCDFYDRVH